MTSRADDLDAAALTLLDEAFAAPAEERRAIIIEKTEANPDLRERTLALFETAFDDDAPITGGGLRILDETLAPDIVGNYKIEREIGRGGMGAVYLGRRIAGDFDHAAAIKLVRLTGRSKVFSDRLRSERRLLAQLKHPNIAQLHDGGETEDGAPYFIMEYVDGAPLYDYLRTHEVDLSERLRIFAEICNAIAYAHRNLVIHRDLSPANVLISRDGAVKLIDFGISH
ncbi:MAG: serine/threonine-protein kinase, partial [Amphiplicatus sp.]